MLYHQKAQSLMEYVMVIMVIVMAVMALMPMLRRGAQSMIKAGADEIGDQKSAEQDFSGGYLKRSDTGSKVSGVTRTYTKDGSPGQLTDEVINAYSASAVYMGSSEAD